MKHLVIILVMLVGLSQFSNLQAQKQDKLTTVEITVKGVCGMCKDRIENAAYIKGVKKVEWNKETKVLTVVYRNDKVSEDDIHKSLSEAGHETNKMKANEDAYKKLPACCSYNDGIETH